MVPIDATNKFIMKKMTIIGIKNMKNNIIEATRYNIHFRKIMNILLFFLQTFPISISPNENINPVEIKTKNTADVTQRKIINILS